ncbi:MAG: signal peptidase I [Clostridia bacterium]|nr:signal peptidase I [Clostridia bacterium]
MHEALSWVLAISVAVAAAFLIRAFLFEFVLVDGPSMQPTLETGERIAIEKVSRYSGLPNRGDIVIVHYPNRTENFVKRAIALPGETIEIRNSTVYIDGEPLEEDYVSDFEYFDYGPLTVPEGHVFVMGDNRYNSMDSRALQVGPIPQDAIVGRGLFVIWPPESMHWITADSENEQ